MEALFDDGTNAFSTFDSETIEEIISLLNDLTTKVDQLENNTSISTTINQIEQEIVNLNIKIDNLPNTVTPDITNLKLRVTTLEQQMIARVNELQVIHDTIGVNPFLPNDKRTIWDHIYALTKGTDPGVPDDQNPDDTDDAVNKMKVWLKDLQLPILMIPSIDGDTLGSYEPALMTIGTFINYTKTYAGLDVIFRNLQWVPLIDHVDNINKKNVESLMRMVILFISIAYDGADQYYVIRDNDSIINICTEIKTTLNRPGVHKDLVNGIKDAEVINNMISTPTYNKFGFDSNLANMVDAVIQYGNQSFGRTVPSDSIAELKSTIQLLSNTITAYLAGPIMSGFGRISLLQADDASNIREFPFLDPGAHAELNNMTSPWTFLVQEHPFSYAKQGYARTIQGQYQWNTNPKHTSGEMGLLNMMMHAFSRVPFWDTIRNNDQMKLPWLTNQSDAYGINLYTDDVWIYEVRNDATINMYLGNSCNWRRRRKNDGGNDAMPAAHPDGMPDYDNTGFWTWTVPGHYTALSFIHLTHPYMIPFWDNILNNDLKWVQSDPGADVVVGEVNDPTRFLNWLRELHKVIPNIGTHDQMSQYLMRLSFIYRYMTCPWPKDSNLSSAYRGFMQMWDDFSTPAPWFDPMGRISVAILSELTRAVVDYHPQFNAKVSDMVESMIGSIYSFGAAIDKRLFVPKPTFKGTPLCDGPRGPIFTQGRDSNFLPTDKTVVTYGPFRTLIPSFGVVNIGWKDLNIDSRFLIENSVPICPTDNDRLHLNPLPDGTCNVASWRPYWWGDSSTTPLMLTGNWQATPLLPFKDYYNPDPVPSISWIWMVGELFLQTMADFFLPEIAPLIDVVFSTVQNVTNPENIPSPGVLDILKQIPLFLGPDVSDLAGKPMVDIELVTKLAGVGYPSKRNTKAIKATEVETQKPMTYLERIQSLRKKQKSKA